MTTEDVALDGARTFSLRGGAASAAKPAQAGPEHPWVPLEVRRCEPLAAKSGATVAASVARTNAAAAILAELSRIEAEAPGVRRRRKPAEEPGFVLHTRPWSESSLVADVLTPHFGRVFLIARGAKRPSSNLRGLLVPFSPLKLTWTGRKEAKVLTGAEWMGVLSPLDEEALLSGFYVNELVLRLTLREDPHPGLFASYARVIEALASSDACVRQIGLRSFEAELLAHCGWALEAPPGEDVEFELLPDGSLCKAVPGSQRASWTRSVVEAVALARPEGFGRLGPQDLRAARELLRAAIDLRLEGRPLKSRRVLSELMNLA